MIEYKNVLTTCPYCGTGCALNLQTLDGKMVGVLPAKNHVVSEGDCASRAGMHMILSTTKTA